MSELIPATFTLSRDLLTRIADAAAADDRSRSAVVRRILAAALADHAAAHAEAGRRFNALQKSNPTACSCAPATHDGASGGGGTRPVAAVVDQPPAGAATWPDHAPAGGIPSRTKATR